MPTMRIWISRLLIGIVTAWNLQAAAAFILYPSAFTFAFELSGVAGQAAVRGFGVLVLMWNVPYLAALWNPERYRLALVLSLLMQFIGLVGESCMLFTLPGGHAVLGDSILRFIVFDGIGLVLLAIAWVMGQVNSRG
ncbi:MAG: hypothetical protein FJZ87_05505 [Chloroflexi bacterium]|nr:hypothetical protein [Chloroflexota bacterium]